MPLSLFFNPIPPLTFFAEETVGEAEFAGAAVSVPSAVAGEELFAAVRLGRLRAVVREAAPRPKQRCHRFEQVGQCVEKLRVCGR